MKDIAQFNTKVWWDIRQRPSSYLTATISAISMDADVQVNGTPSAMLSDIRFGVRIGVIPTTRSICSEVCYRLTGNENPL